MKHRAKSGQEKGYQQCNIAHCLGLFRSRYKVGRQPLKLRAMPVPNVEGYCCCNTTKKWPKLLQLWGEKTGNSYSECGDYQTKTAW